MSNRAIATFMMLLFLMLPCIILAQYDSPKSNVFKPTDDFQKPKGFLNYLLDPSKFSMSHSYSISAISMGKQTFTQGLYLNTMNFRFSDPLFMQVRVGYLHQPLGGLGNQKGMNGNLFLQRAMVQYKPAENMSFTLDYQVLPSPLMNPYYYRW